MKVDILAIGVHPDDIELSCSGYLLKEIAAGRTVALLDLTHGELGTRGNAALRKRGFVGCQQIGRRVQIISKYR